MGSRGDALLEGRPRFPQAFHRGVDSCGRLRLEREQGRHLSPLFTVWLPGKIEDAHYIEFQMLNE